MPNTRGCGLISPLRRNPQPMPKSGRGCRTRHNISHQILVPALNPKSIGHARCHFQLTRIFRQGGNYLLADAGAAWSCERKARVRRKPKLACSNTWRVDRYGHPSMVRVVLRGSQFRTTGPTRRPTMRSLRMAKYASGGVTMMHFAMK
jgi:hypothetical protein